MRHEKKSGWPGSVSRRDLLKAMSIAPAAALVPLAPAVTALAASGERGNTSGPYEPKVFNPHEWTTIHVLSDLIVPADERTGSATQAGVPAFIDDWLNLKGGLLRTEVLGGLTWVDMECNQLFGRDFVDCSEGQQKQILDRIAYPEKAAPEDSNAVAAFNHIRDLVLEGFYSSKMGVEDLQYQGNKMLAEWDGCPEIVTSRLGVDYSDWENWRS
jgi:gluconate 2-dehydrogenase gamma chain